MRNFWEPYTLLHAYTVSDEGSQAAGRGSNGLVRHCISRNLAPVTS